MFDINAGEFLVLAVIVLIVVGPERLPQYAAQLGRLVRDLRKYAQGAKEQVRAELGPDFDDVDWEKLDPRQYDPRRIVREALQDAWDDDDVKPTASQPVTMAKQPAVGAGAAAAVGAGAGARSESPGRGAHRGPAPFDNEAT